MKAMMAGHGRGREMSGRGKVGFFIYIFLEQVGHDLGMGVWLGPVAGAGSRTEAEARCGFENRGGARTGFRTCAGGRTKREARCGSGEAGWVLFYFF